MSRFTMLGAIACAGVVGLLSCTEHGPTDVGGSPDAGLALGAVLLVPDESMSVAALLPDVEAPTDAVNQLHWSTSDPTVVAVVADTLLVTKAEGSAEISGASSTARYSRIVQVWRDHGGNVASITVTLAQSALQVGDTTRATAVLTDARGTPLLGRTVAWYSTNPTVATVTPSGRVRALSAGTASIIAWRKDVSGSAALGVSSVATQPPPAPVASLGITLARSTLIMGDSTTASAIARDAAGNVLAGRLVAWSSDNAAVATVSSSGVVRSLTPGSANIIGTSESVTGTAPLTVSGIPPAPVATVSVSLNSSSLNPGASTQATATTRDAGGVVLAGRAVSWSSDAPAVATVSATGLVTAVTVGSAIITATSEGKSGSATMSVISAPPVPALPVASVSVTLNASALTVGQVTQATATTRDANNVVLTGRAISWASDNSAAATVSASGLVTAVGAGRATITGTSEGISGAASLQVTSVAATQLAVATQPAGAVSGMTLATQPVVQVRDAQGALVASGVAVSAALAGGTGRLSGTTTVNAVNGVATFAGLRVDGVAGSYTLIFTAPGLSLATSAAFPLTQTPAALTVQTQPGGATTGMLLAPQPIVRIVDNAGLLIPAATLSVRAAVTSGTGVLSGTTSVAAVGGVATFTTLGISGTGAQVLTFSTATPALQVAAAPVTIASAVATRLTITTQPAETASSAIAFSRQPVLQVRDAAGGAVPQAGVVVTAAIATGGGTLNGTTTALTNASGVATFTNLSITGTDGSRTLSFSAPGLTAATSTAIAVGVALATGEPAFDASGTLVLQDNMDSYTTATAMGATSSSTAPRIVPNPSPVATSQAVNTYSNQVITGRNGTGKALRMGYTGVYQQGATFYTLNQPSTPILATHYFQYWARVNFSAALNGTVAIKWFEAWHTGRDRVQWNTHNASSAHVGKQWTYWQVYDQGRETPGQGDQPVGPYFNDLNDNQWHRFTYEYRPNSAPGARNGVARMWIDGTKVIDISAATIGVTPVGGDKPWCTSADVDALTVNEGITNLVWGSTQTTTTPAWTYDIDDLVWWRK